jgi:UDP-glucose 4-epimerase
MRKRTKVLVTGGAGFIGSHLVDRLVSEGMQVVVLDNLSSGCLKNLDGCFGRIRFVKGDIRDEGLTRDLVRDTQVVFHLAANASVPESVNNPEYNFHTNVVGTFNLLQSSVGHSLESFVFSSSAAVYGSSDAALSESSALNPVSPYGTAKLCGELLGLSYKRIFKVPFVVARIFNVYGPRMSRYAMYDFYRKLKNNPLQLEVLGTGRQERQFCHISDAVDAIMLIAEKGKDVYNVAGGEVVSIEELANIFVKKISPEARTSFTGVSWPGDIEKLLTDTTKLRKLGFTPKISLSSGIDFLIEWFNENPYNKEG